MIESRRASGNIGPALFVMPAGTQGYCAQSTANQPPVGVSPEWTNAFPGTPANSSYLAAADGGDIRVYGPGEVATLKLGGTANPDDFLKSDGNGAGVALGAYSSSTGQWVGARAIEGGVSGDYVKARVLQPFLY